MSWSVLNSCGAYLKLSGDGKWGWTYLNGLRWTTTDRKEAFAWIRVLRCSFGEVCKVVKPKDKLDMWHVASEIGGKEWLSLNGDDWRWTSEHSKATQFLFDSARVAKALLIDYDSSFKPELQKVRP